MLWNVKVLVPRCGLWWTRWALYVVLWRNAQRGNWNTTLCATWKLEHYVMHNVKKRKPLTLRREYMNTFCHIVSARLLTYCLLKNACLIKTPPCLIWRLCHIKHWWHYVCNTTMFVCLCVTWVWNMYKLCITVWRINHALQEVGIILLTERIMIVEKSNQAYIAHWQLLDLTWISILVFRASHLLICCFQSRT